MAFFKHSKRQLSLHPSILRLSSASVNCCVTSAHLYAGRMAALDIRKGVEDSKGMSLHELRDPIVQGKEGDLGTYTPAQLPILPEISSRTNMRHFTDFSYKQGKLKLLAIVIELIATQHGLKILVFLVFLVFLDVCHTCRFLFAFL